MKNRWESLRAALLAFACLLLPLLWLFRASFEESKVVFSNDGPFGMLVSQFQSAGEAFTGYWVVSNWLGRHELEPLPGFTQTLYLLVGSPLLFAKWFPVIGLAFFGTCAWALARRLGLGWWGALCVGLAAELNTNPFSYACWGLVPKPVAFGFFLLSMAVVEGERTGWRAWVRAMLAGFALGFNVMEGGDVGVILSLYFAGYVAWTTLLDPARDWGSVLRGVLRLGLSTVCALWLAGQAVVILQGFAVKGVSGMGQSQAGSAERWQFITGWSLPPEETTRLFVPGLYGYRMDTPDGGNYRGRVGADGSPPRFSGSGEYVGLPVLLVALWAAARGIARSGRQPFDAVERRRIWFWALAAGLSLLVSYGHYFPLFRVVFAMPVLNTIRIPMKYLHGMHLSLVILFGYGLLGLHRLHLSGPAPLLAPLRERWAQWWRSAQGFDRRFGVGLGALGAVAALWVLLGLSSGDAWGREIAASGFKLEDARAMARFASAELALFLGVLLATLIVLALAVSGYGRSPAGENRRWLVLLAVLVTLDLGRAAAPWVVHADYRHRYEKNPVVQYLQGRRDDQARVTSRLLPFSRSLLAQPNDSLWAVVQNLWLEHHLQYFQIQTLDVIQWPRTPELDSRYRDNFGLTPEGQLDLRSIGRLWQLTSTRYLLGAAGIARELESVLAPARVTPRLLFSLEPKPGVTQQQAEREADAWTAVANTNGPYAVMEFTGALPRAKLYSDWQVSADDAQTLARLKAPDFDPARQVLLSADPGLGPVSAPGAATEGTARITAYAPRRVQVATRSSAPAVLLLNDRWDEHWLATLDGRPAPVLRANHIMRAVAVPAGEHAVEFRYAPPMPALRSTLVAIGVCFLTLLAFVWPARQAAPPSTPKPRTP